MAHAEANAIRIEYETFGERSAPALLLIAGNGAQLIFWDVELCEALASAGFFVIRFDNRDAGLSTWFDEAGVPDMMASIKDAMEGRPVHSAYSLGDMAADAVGLLDALGIAQAHVCGLSMGGMIAQVMACRHPQRVLSLTSIMSCTGNPAVPMGRQEAITAVVAPPPEGRDAYIEHCVNIWRQIWSPGYPFEEARARAFMAESYDRAHHLQGMARQNAAILAAGDRRAALASIAAPTLVLHGADDPLMPVEAGRDTAASIPGARLRIIEGMGHDLPTGVWPILIAALAEHARLTGGAR